MKKFTLLLLLLIFLCIDTLKADITDGYYYMISKATDRAEYIYNNALLSGNTNNFSLQSDSKVTTNNGIWHITNNGNNTIGIKNGDGNNLIAGASQATGIAGNYNQLTIGETVESGGYVYYFFNEKINCSNGGWMFQIGDGVFVTTWADGTSSANDLLWRFESVDVTSKNVYNVDIETSYEGTYVSYNNGTTIENAFDGGFFISSTEITTSALSVNIPNQTVLGADIEIAEGTISISNVRLAVAPTKQDLFNTSNGSLSIPPYRIPGIAKTKTGRLIAVAGRLVCGTDPGYGRVDVVCRISDNDGESWSEIRDVANGTGETSATVNYFDTAFGDPAIVADRTSEEVAIIAVAGCTVYGNANTTRQNPNLIALIRSYNNGETWETPIDITERIYSLFDSGNAIEAAFVAGGKVFQSRIVKKGKYYRLYAAMCARPNGNRVIYSDDFGETWHALGGAFALPATGGDEPKCEEMPDGRVILSSRVAGGRIYNIYTYENTLEGTGEWSTDVKSTFAGSNLTPGNNSTNGEILIVPVKRNSDQKEMYLALQSLPTGSTRTNVGIYYKELTDFTDMNSVANFCVDWNGFFQVSNTESAYSSMDLQADNKIGFIYEETLTKHGTVQNPISTSFPNGEGTHNYDGFDNLYVGYDLEYITNGVYSIKNDVDRRAFIQTYFRTLVDESSISTALATEVNDAINTFSEEPTTAEVDYIYELLRSELPSDPWDGKTVTLTNVQQSGTEYALYINGSTLSTSSSTAETLGESAEFLCTKQANGKYTFFNEASNLFLIWRAGNNYGYNNNSGTLSSYNGTYCDWSINDASSTKSGSYYLVSKRSDGSTDGSFVIMSATGNFDSWGNSVAWASNYSNLFRIDVVEDETTNLESVINTEKKFFDGGKIYDLYGREIKNPTKGIYIINGEKVFVNQH